MEIPFETMEAVNKVLLDAFNGEFVKDFSMQYDFDSVGDECIRIKLYMDPNAEVEKHGDSLFGLPCEIDKVLDGDLKSIRPHIEFGTAED